MILFISHGAPTLPLEDIPAAHFLRELGAKIPRPKSILCLSAHWMTEPPAITGASQPETIHDFYGFPEALYRMRYPAPGDPDLANKVSALLRDAGIDSVIDPNRGLDHGAWNPLMLMYPQAQIPVAQLSIQPDRDPQWHFDVGKAIAPLAGDDVLIVASGGAVHNLLQFRVDREHPADWAVRFDDWLAAAIGRGDTDALLNYESHPDADQAHPSNDHFLPLFVALGAAGNQVPGKALHRSFAHGSLSMACFAWNPLQVSD